MKLNDVLQKFINNKLIILARSKFGRGFKLVQKDLAYINDRSLDVIETHARAFICKRLVYYNVCNDGKQTLTRGHPVFVAQHATATCCRECLYKWHHIEKGKQLEAREVNFVVALIMEWIKMQLERTNVFYEEKK